MRNAAMLFLGLVLVSGLSTGQLNSKEIKTMNVKRITPVLYVKEVEPCVKFWVERLGFEKTVEVPDGDRLGFAMLQKNNLEIMYQSIASAEKDIPAAAKDISGGRTFLYVEVEKLDDIIAALKGVDLALPLRTTFYGAKEIGVKDPAGHMIVFAEMGAPPQK
ncbi:MAG TPA: VOC family protein [Candidatus Angelobacter sp.]|nr:VOC family protein [Candidatus Angelobacter sp.]